MGPVTPNVTPRALAALDPVAVLLAAVPVALLVAPSPPLAVEDAVVLLSEPDLVTSKVRDWVMMPELEPVLPMKLIW